MVNTANAKTQDNCIAIGNFASMNGSAMAGPTIDPIPTTANNIPNFPLLPPHSVAVPSFSEIATFKTSVAPYAMAAVAFMKIKAPKWDEYKYFVESTTIDWNCPQIDPLLVLEWETL